MKECTDYAYEVGLSGPQRSGKFTVEGYEKLSVEQMQILRCL